MDFTTCNCLLPHFLTFTLQARVYKKDPVGRVCASFNRQNSDEVAGDGDGKAPPPQVHPNFFKRLSKAWMSAAPSFLSGGQKTKMTQASKVAVVAAFNGILDGDYK